MDDRRLGKRVRKKKNLEHFSPSHTVRATGRAMAERREKKCSTDVNLRVRKPSPETKVGIDLKYVMHDEGKEVVVLTIEPDSLFAASGLSVGMKVKTINGLRCPSAKTGRAMLNLAEGNIIVVAEPGRTADEGGTSLGAPSTPPSNANPKPSESKKFTPFRSFLNKVKTPSKNEPPRGQAPAVVLQGRVHFDKTPANTKRQNDFKNTIHHGLERLGESILRKKSPKSRKELMKGVVVPYYDETRGKFYRPRRPYELLLFCTYANHFIDLSASRI